MLHKKKFFFVLATTAFLLGTFNGQAVENKPPSDGLGLPPTSVISMEEKPKIPNKKKISPAVRALTEKYNEDVKRLTSDHKILLSRIQEVLNDPNGNAQGKLEVEQQLTELQTRFSDFERIHSSDTGIGEKRSEANQLSEYLVSLNKQVTTWEKSLKTLKNNQGRKALTASAEALLNNQHVGNKSPSINKETKENARKRLQEDADKRHNKRTRPGAQGPDAKDRDALKEAHEAKKVPTQRPFGQVEYVKLAKGDIPAAGMLTVVDIRNIIRKSKDRAQVVEELRAFEKAIKFKEVTYSYLKGQVPLKKSDADVIYQMRINDKYRVIIAFKAGKYVAPNGEQMDLDLLYNNTIWVLDPHKK